MRVVRHTDSLLNGVRNQTRDRVRFRVIVFCVGSLMLFLVSCVEQAGIDPQKGSRLTGKVVSVIDGDTYDLLVRGNGTIRVRMQGIDAPEREMPYYRASKNHLSGLCFGKNVTLEVTGRDSGGRILGFTYLEDDRELCQEMIRAGYAWHFKRYNSDKVLSDLEKEARLSKRGLWTDPDPVPPWEYRQKMRESREE